MLMPISAASTSTLSSVANANGAVPSSTGFMPRTRCCMIGLPTMVISRTSVGSISACSTTSTISSLIAWRTTSISCFSPPGFIMMYDTRLIRSSPKRICGFIRPALATTSPLVSSQRCAAIVVEPTSKAMPYRCSLKPGQIATMRSAFLTATVTWRLPLVSAPCNACTTCNSQLRFRSAHSLSNARNKRCKSP